MKKKKKHSEVVIPHSHFLWVGFIVPGLILCFFIWALMSYKGGKSSSDDIFVYTIMSIPILLFGYLITICILEYQDYVKFSSEGIEYVLHPAFRSFFKGTRGFVRWEDVKEYTVTETHANGRYGVGSIRHLVLHLYNKEKPVKLSFDSLHGSGRNIRHYVNMYSDCKYYDSNPFKISYDELFKKEKPSWYYPKKVKKDDKS